MPQIALFSALSILCRERYFVYSALVVVVVHLGSFGALEWNGAHLAMRILLRLLTLGQGPVTAGS